jgi:hypothetical protein
MQRFLQSKFGRAVCHGVGVAAFVGLLLARAHQAERRFQGAVRRLPEPGWSHSPALPVSAPQRLVAWAES